MGSAEPEPSAFEVTAFEGTWLSIPHLSLESPGIGHTAAGDAPAAAAQAPRPLRNRRLRLRGAVLELTAAQLNRALAALPAGAAGLANTRVWMAPEGPRLAGTFTAANRRAEFTVRPVIVARADAPRRVRVGLSDVRLYGALPLPAPLVGLALARALRAAARALAGPSVGGAGPYLDLDPLALALEHALVARGARLPDLSPGWLEAVECAATPDGGETTRPATRVRLRFGAAGARAVLDGPPLPLLPAVEGQPLPDELLAGEAHLNAGELVAAETAFRTLARTPGAVLARARLLALRAAAGGPDVAPLATQLLEDWPEFVPAWLALGVAAMEGADRPRAADAFARAAALCDARGEHEDGRLARAAEQAARSHAPPLQPAPDAAETTQQDEPPRASAPLETTIQDPGPPAFAGPADTTPPPDEEEAAIPSPQAPGLTDRTEQAIAHGALDEADALLEQRLAAARDPQHAAALLAERARVQLLGPEGARRALDTLRTVPCEALPEEGLVLRADLAARAGDLDDAREALALLQARAEAAGDMAQARALAQRQAELADEAAAALAEEALLGDDELAALGDVAPLDDGGAAGPDAAGGPISAGVTVRTETIYASAADEQSRLSALGHLLEEFETLEPERQHASYASFGRVAEASGDLEHAEEAYWRATRVPGEPARRADDLLAHARVLLARGNVANAIAELEEALALVPEHAPALALLAEQAFAARDWDNARRAYARLDGAPGAADVIDRALLMHRRAVLARAAGDTVEAQACLEELAELSPRDVGARRALAELALERGDARAAAARWEEVVRLLPMDALDALLEVRQQLTDVHARLGDWDLAHYYAELVLAQEPRRVSTLERLVEIDEHLGLYPAAVELLERLARAYPHPRQRAAALYRQGELLLKHMNDPARAFDAHLRAWDLDPTHTPTIARVLEGYWRAGDFREAAAVGDELRNMAPLAELTLNVRVRWALAAALATGRGEGAGSGLDGVAWSPDVAAAALAEAAAALVAQPPEALEPAVTAVESWAKRAGESSATAPHTDQVREALRATIERDAATPGAARILGWLAEREGDALGARAFYALATFADMGAGARSDGALARLDELGRAPAATERALAMLGPGDHPACTGAAAPLRRALAGLAHALNGFERQGAHPQEAPAPPSPIDQQAALTAGVQADYAALARVLDAPPAALLAGADDGTASARMLTGGLHVVPGQPTAVVVPAALLGLPQDELRFLVAHALDHLRCGLAMVEHATDGTGAGVGALLDGARAALTGDEVPEQDSLAGAVAQALADVERRAALLGPLTVAAMVESLEQGRALVKEWGTFRDAAERASDRFAVLACCNPLAALRALYRADAPATTASDEHQRRASFLRGGRVRELVAFVVSPDYARALRQDDTDG